MKKIIVVFLISFALNWIWEILHSALYLNYQGGAITSFILFRAALVDAVIITGLVFAANKSRVNRSAFIISCGIVIAIGIEMWALSTGRWAYNTLMPIIPFLNIGLTPTIQLASTGYISSKLTKN